MPLGVVAVAVAGIGIGNALAGRDDTSSPAQAATGQLADINQACTTWVISDTRSGGTPGRWCQDMTSWMNQQMANRSMMGSMMWGDPERMLATCRSWVTANPSVDRPSDWCDSMLRGMWPHMTGDWGDWDDSMNGPMMGGG
jgi:hypothetical protein